MKQAFINEILEKDTTAGKMYDFVFSDGNKVGAGKFPPKGFVPGDYVQYDFTEKGQYKNLKAGSMSKLNKPAGVTAPSEKPGFKPANDKKQEVISRQAALNSALTFVGLLQASGALTLPKTKADAADALQGIVHEYTRRFYFQSVGEEMVVEDAPDYGSASNGTNLAVQEADGEWDSN